MDQSTTAPLRTFSLWKYSVGGFVAGLIVAAINNIWYAFFPYLSDVRYPSSIDEMALTIGSFVPPIIASILYYFISSKNYDKGTKIYVLTAFIVFVLSIVVQFYPEILVNYNLLEANDIPENLALLTVPFHISTLLVTLIFIPKFVGMKD